MFYPVNSILFVVNLKGWNFAKNPITQQQNILSSRQRKSLEINSWLSNMFKVEKTNGSQTATAKKFLGFLA